VAHRNSGKHSARRAEQIETRLRAMRLRLQGLSFQEIADALKKDKSQVVKWIKAEFARREAELTATLDDVRKLELTRIDRLFALHWSKADDPRRTEILVRLMERRAAMLGLDAPKELSLPYVTQEPERAYNLSLLSMEELRVVRAGLIKASGGKPDDDDKPPLLITNKKPDDTEGDK
jgi:hypothetical protein